MLVLRKSSLLLQFIKQKNVAKTLVKYVIRKLVYIMQFPMMKLQDMILMKTFPLKRLLSLADFTRETESGNLKLLVKDIREAYSSLLTNMLVSVWLLI